MLEVRTSSIIFQEELLVWVDETIIVYIILEEWKKTSNYKNNETIITTTIRLMYILLEEELWAWLEIWKKTPGCRYERRESEGIGANQREEEGRKWGRLQMNGWVGGALFIGRPYTPAVTSADVCMTVHFSAYQRCDENDGAFQRFQPLKWTAGVKVKTVKKLFNFFFVWK